HAGHRPRQHHAVLVDGHRGVHVAPLLGDRTRCNCRVQGSAPARQAPRRLHGVPGRALPGTAPLGEARVPQPRLLQRGPQRRALRCLGGAGDLLAGASGRLQGSSVAMATQQVPGLHRTDLQRHDLSIPGREVIQNRVDIDPDAPAIRHWHPGEEIIYVLEGLLEYEIDGQAPQTVTAGEALTVPAETVHAVRNVGDGDAAELATYVVEKGRPLLNLAE